MKSCIYQKQEPVNIPQAETRTLKDVLELPWGFEIYSLLTRWNPLNLRRPYPQAATGKQRAGRRPRARGLHARAPPHERRPRRGRHRRPEDRAARRRSFGRRPARQRACRSEPIRDIAELHEPLDERAHGGLRRRRRVRHHGALGQELPQDHPPAARAARAVRHVRRRALRRHADASTTRSPLGFDHIALCAGAGTPTVLEIPNGFARGVRAASDFLMALQLTGAAQARLDRQPADPPAGGGDRRRPDRDRHRDRVARLLRRAGREVPARYEALERQTPSWNPEERAIARGIHRATRSALREPRRRQSASRCCKSWGGVDHRLPPAPRSTARPTRSTTRKSRRRSRKASLSPRA